MGSEDWIALVKAAAAAAAKNKTGSKPRTSANSNKDKDKDERKWFKVPSKKEETSTCIATPDVEKKEDLPTSSETFDKLSYMCSVESRTSCRERSKDGLSTAREHIIKQEEK
ncbi:PHF20L1 isoform 18, partial [Pan troglodytes]